MPKSITSPQSAKFSTADFFVLRTPQMSEDRLLDWQGDEERLRTQLKSWVSLPEVEEALYLASPSLSQRIEYWLKEPNSERGKKVELALTKYFVRMTTRCTPFGLFAGIGIGNIKGHNHLSLVDIRQKRHSRLDSLILFELKQHLLTRQDLVNQLPIKVNQSLYLLGKRYRYIEAYSRENKRHYQLSSFTNTPYIQHILDCCQNETSPVQVAKSLCQFDADISRQDALDFIFQLVQNNILEPQLPLYLTHEHSEHAFIEALKALKLNEQKGHPVVEPLRNCLEMLNKIDNTQVNDLSLYQSIQDELRQLPIKIAESKSIQTDLFIGDSHLALSERFCQSLCKDLALLAQISHPPKDVFDEFKSQFIERYEYQAVPLKEVLDDESGIGFSQNRSVDSPLLAGVHLNKGVSEDKARWTAIDSLLMSRFSDSEFENKQEIQLTKADIAKLVKSRKSRHQPQAPASMHALISLYSDSNDDVNKGNYQVRLMGISGPSTANMLGRFCHLDEELKARVKAELAWEETQYPDAILAEIVHLPEGRVGNVIARPVLRDHEISFLSDQNAQQATQLSLDDLYVYIENDMVKLWSKQHHKEVIPRLSSAHNYNKNSLGIYRFLASLPYQKTALPGFMLAEPILQMPYFPRITLGKLILSPQRWRIPRHVIQDLSRLTGEAFKQQSHNLSKKYRLADVLVFRQDDLSLTLTLDNPCLIEMLLSETRAMDTIVLEEKHPAKLRSPVSKNGQIFNHEILLPLRNTDFRCQPSSQSPAFFEPHYTNEFTPGNEWLCAKIYVGFEAADQLLTQVLADWLITLKNQSVINHFFFLRYADPNWHVRLRVQVNSPEQNSQIYQQLCERIHQAQKLGLVNRMEIIPYHRETQRYGGQKGMLEAEKVFTLDSLCSLQLLRHLPQNEPDFRWQITLWGCEYLLQGLGLNDDQKYRTIAQLRHSFGAEFNESGKLRNVIGNQFKKHQQKVQNLLEHDSIPPEFKPCHDILIERNLGLASIGETLQELSEKQQLTSSIERITTSFLHMFTNRMLQHKGREHELLIYDFILRHYKQRKARKMSRTLM